MPIKRPKGYCPACEAVVEFYSDGLGGNSNWAWRCGNCFQGFDDAALTTMERVQQDLEEHERKRQEILDKALRRSHANAPKN